MPITSISRIQHRRGLKADLPESLNEGEFGWCLDTKELYIGNGPMWGQNTEVLTENSNNIDVIKTKFNTYNSQLSISAVRSLGSKLNDIASVKDFGAVGDGETDDTVAINTAISTLLYNNGVINNTSISLRVPLHFPAGVYCISSTLLLYPYVTLIGEGSDKTIIRVKSGSTLTSMLTTADGTGNTYANINISGSPLPEKIVVANLSLETNGSNVNIAELVRYQNIRFEDVKFVGDYSSISSDPTVFQTGARLYSIGNTVNTFDAQFVNCEFTKLAYGIYSDDPVTLTSVAHSSFYNLYKGMVFGLATNYAGPATISVTSNRFYNIRKYAIYVGNPAPAVASTSNTFKNCGSLTASTSIFWDTLSYNNLSLGDVADVAPLVTDNGTNNLIIDPQQLNLGVLFGPTGPEGPAGSVANNVRVINSTVDTPYYPMLSSVLSGNSRVQAASSLSYNLISDILSAGTMTAGRFIPTSPSVPVSGVFSPALGTVGISTGTTERVRVSSSGNVGIGTQTPATQLHLVGNLRVDNTTTSSSGIIFPDGSFQSRSASSSLNIFFKQAGLNSVTRTVQSKLEETISVNDFGAVGNGSTDDGSAIAAALVSATSRNASVEFTAPGTYRWVTPLDITGQTVSFAPAAQMNAPYVPWTVNGANVYGRAVTGTGVGPKSARINQDFRKNLVVVGDAAGATGEQRSGETMIIDVSGRCSDSEIKAFAYNTYINYGLYEGIKNNSEGTVACYNGRITVYDLIGNTSAGTKTEITPLANGVVCQWDSKPIQTWQQKNGNYYNDIVMHGPVTTSSADRENYLAGLSIYASKWSPGTTVQDGFHGSYGLTIHTDAKGGGFGGNNASGKDSYIMNAGIAIQGWSGVQGVPLAGGHDSSAQAGYDVGLQIGGSYASVWTNWTEVGSRLNTGIVVEDYQTTGIYVKSSYFGPGNPGLRVDAPVFFQHGQNEPKLNINGYGISLGEGIRFASTTPVASAMTFNSNANVYLAQVVQSATDVTLDGYWRVANGYNSQKLEVANYGTSLGQGLKFSPATNNANAMTFHNSTGTQVGRIAQSANGIVYEAGAAGGFAFAGGPTWTVGTGSPVSSQPVGSIYSRTDGTPGSCLYVRTGSGSWTAVA